MYIPKNNSLFYKSSFVISGNFNKSIPTYLLAPPRVIQEKLNFIIRSDLFADTPNS